MNSKFFASRSSSLKLDLAIVKDNLPIEVVPNLYVGSLHAACNRDELISHGIKHILNLSGEHDAQYSKYFSYLSIDLRDKDYSNLLSCIPAADMFINAGMTKGGVLVHCRGGRSRSPAVIVAYLMKYRKMSFEESSGAVRRVRSVMSINKGFIRQLLAYEKHNFDIYKAQQHLLRKRVRQMAEARTNDFVSSPRRQSLSVARVPARLRFTSPGSAGVNIIPPLRGLDHEFICRNCHALLFISSSVIRHRPGDNCSGTRESSSVVGEAKHGRDTFAGLRRNAEASPEISRARKRMSRERSSMQRHISYVKDSDDWGEHHRRRSSSKITIFSSDEETEDEKSNESTMPPERRRFIDCDKDSKSPSVETGPCLTGDSNFSTLSYSGPIDDSADFDSPDESPSNEIEEMSSKAAEDRGRKKAVCSSRTLPQIRNGSQSTDGKLTDRDSYAVDLSCRPRHAPPSTPRRGARRGRASPWSRPTPGAVASRLRSNESESDSTPRRQEKTQERTAQAVRIPHLPLHLATSSLCAEDMLSSPRGVVSISARSAGSASSVSFPSLVSSSVTASPSRNRSRSPRLDMRLRTPGRVTSPETGKRCMRRWQALQDSGNWDRGDRICAEMAESVVRRDLAESVIQCERCFVEPMEWMGTLQKSSGVLQCPNPQCDARLGTWNWHGEHCTCGVFVSPAFMVEKRALYSRERPLTVRGEKPRRRRRG